MVTTWSRHSLGNCLYLQREGIWVKFGHWSLASYWGVIMRHTNITGALRGVVFSSVPESWWYKKGPRSWPREKAKMATPGDFAIARAAPCHLAVGARCRYEAVAAGIFVSPGQIKLTALLSPSPSPVFNTPPHSRVQRSFAQGAKLVMPLLVPLP